MMDSASDGLWTLPCDGVAMPVEAVRLALALEDRGLRLRREGEMLKVYDPKQPTPALSESDVAAIRRWKPNLLVLVDYCARH